MDHTETSTSVMRRVVEATPLIPAHSGVLWRYLKLECSHWEQRLEMVGIPEVLACRECRTKGEEVEQSI